MKKSIIILLLLTTIGCTMVVKTVNQSKDLEKLNLHSDLSTYANEYFWRSFHNGDYSKIDSVLYYLSAAYNENPNHLETVTHLGFTHMWALSERQKLETIPPTIIEHGTLALKYYGESYKLNPNDPRILGFLADAKMTVASLSNDKKLSTDGYFNGKKSINQWKEFNYFTIGYVLSQLHQDSWQFEKALEWQWKTLDECYCEKFDRENPGIEKYLPMENTETNLKRKRACWNSWIAPHNVEGFYLNMGDMLVKNGDWEKAVEIYSLAKQVPQYENWTYKGVLEKRIKSAKNNVDKFRLPIDNAKKYKVDDVMLINSSISCMSCHKKSNQDLTAYGNFDWKKYKEEKNIYWMKK
jgi:tetratricopeptide (TPR) repeat protein|tara:strand:- start:191 stop:1249 length:1059 start_codon:yes stop_codon:yes gene_type:complete